MRKRLLCIVAAGAAAMLALSSCGGSDSGNSTPNAAPTDKVLHLSFLQDPGQPPDPDIYYAGQGLLLTTNLYEGLLQFKGGQAKTELEPLLATEYTASSWPRSTTGSPPPSALHTRTVLSLAPEATRRPSGLNATALIGAS